jgi:hypothetical protein
MAETPSSAAGGGESPTNPANGAPEPAKNSGAVAVASKGGAVARSAQTAYPAHVTEGAALLGISEEEFLRDMMVADDAIMENVEEGEIQISRIGIAQPTSPKVAGNEDGWLAGMLFDNQSQEIITTSGKAPWQLAKNLPDVDTLHYVAFVPLFKLPNEFVLWPTSEERDAGMTRFYWKTLDGSEERVREGMWKPKGTWEGTGSPPVTETINILGICLNDDGTPKSGLIVATFARTSFKTGKKLVTACVQQKMNKLPFFGRVYYLYTEKKIEPKKKQTYYIIQFAKGPQLLQFGSNPEVTASLYREAHAAQKKLSDATNGRYLQELYINAAKLADADESGAIPGEGHDERDIDDVAGTNEPKF